MADNATPIATLLEQVEDYSKTSIELFKLNAIDKTAEIASSFASSMVTLYLVALSLLIVNIGLALWIGEMLGNSFYGFFIIGGFYGLVAILVHIFRQQWIKYPVSNSVIKQMLAQKP